MKKIIKLINNERLAAKTAPSKACTSGAVDICYIVDSAHCSTYAYDDCDKDYSACHAGADDICITNKDHDIGCSGAGEVDLE